MYVQTYWQKLQDKNDYKFSESPEMLKRIFDMIENVQQKNPFLENITGCHDIDID